MKRMKWICRYAFLGLLLAGGIFWAVYCQITVSELNARIYSLEYIDLAVSLSNETLELLDRAEQFTQMRNAALIASAVLAVCIAALVAFQILSKKLAAKKTVVREKPRAVPEAPKAVPEVPVDAGVICAKCGQHYEQKPSFCVRCGNKFE